MFMKGLNPGASHFKSRLSLIVRVNAVLNGTDVVDSRVYSGLIVVKRQP